MFFLMHALIFGFTVTAAYFDRRQVAMLYKLVDDPRVEKMSDDEYTARIREIADWWIMKAIAVTVAISLLIIRLTIFWIKGI